MAPRPVEKKSAETLFNTVMIAKLNFKFWFQNSLNHISSSSEVESSGTEKEYTKSNLKSYN